MARDALNQVRIAAPCGNSWHSMTGDDRVRFCCECKLNVFNIDKMSRPEALALIQSHEGRLCVRLHRRSDGTVITKNCPVGLAAMRKRLAYAIAFVGAIALGSFTMPMASLKPKDESYHPSLVDQARDWPVIGKVIEAIDPQSRYVVGAIAMPTSRPSPKPGP